jgi:hypothetical protein
MSQGKKRHKGWLTLGYIMVAFTILLVLGAINNLVSSPGGDAAENAGRLVGTILFPVVVGYFARFCLRKSKR